MRSTPPFPRLCVALLSIAMATFADTMDAAAQALLHAPTHNDYSKAENWLCRPGRTDACSLNQDTTIVAADGSLAHETFHADAQAPIDCFYLYPTVSLDPTPNSDMLAGDEERGVVYQQFARFASRCRTYAPLYRQMTLAQLRKAIANQGAGDQAMADADVLDAWTWYLEHDNQGRGVVLIGDSQGAGELTQLLQERFDGKPLQKQLVSAILAGTGIAVPKGHDVGATFKAIPLCHAAQQTGCVITYASFRAARPPDADSILDPPVDPTLENACTNPANLAGGEGVLEAYLAAHARGFGDTAAAPAWVRGGAEITTPFVALPQLLSAHCAMSSNGPYLAITLHGAASDARTQDINGDVVVRGRVRPRWGLHPIDINLALGNLLDIVDEQARAWLHEHAASK